MKTVKTAKTLLGLMLAALMLASCIPAMAEETAAEYPEKLRIWYPGYSDHFSSIGMKDQNDAWCWQEISRITGTQLEWEYGASGNDGMTNLNLLIASRDLPDIIGYNWKNIPGGAQMYCEDEIIVDLTDLMDTNLKDYKAAMEAVNSLGDIKAADGHFYFIAQAYDKLGGGVYMGLIIRQDMLDEMGEAAPTTLDEYHELLKKAKAFYGDAFYPMTGTGFKANSGIGPLLWAFGIDWDFYVEDGKVCYGPMSDRFADAMTYVSTLYAEELIDPDYATQDRTAMTGKIMADNSMVTYDFQPRGMMNAMATQDPTFKLVGLTNLKESADSRPYSYDSNYISSMQYGSSAAISTACEEPDKAANFLNFIFTDEGYRITNYGEEHADWTYGEDGVVQFTEAYNALIAENFELQHTRHFGTAAVFPYRCSLDAYWNSLPPVALEAIKVWVATNDMSGIMPAVSLTGEETEEITDWLADINTYMEEAYAGLVNGKIAIDEIPGIQDDLRAMHIERIIEVYQAAYGRYVG